MSSGYPGFTPPWRSRLDDGYPVRDEDVARLSPFMPKHLNVNGHYTFRLPDLGGARRALRDPNAPDDERD